MKSAWLARALAIAMVMTPLALFASGAAQLAPADAANFMGSWTVSLNSPQGSFDQTVVLKDEGGKVVAEMSSAMAPDTQKVTDVTKKGDDLVLKFAGNFQGNPFDAVITMTPDGADKCKVMFDINGGQFSMDGAGTRKK
jgi:hypothetical protein